VSGPESSGASVATVADYRSDTGRLCLRGDAVADHEGAEDGRLCGTWRRTRDAGPVPQQGDRFRFVTMTAEGPDAGVPRDQSPVILIYGDVVP
jgi:hypothetical protein